MKIYLIFIILMSVATIFQSDVVGVIGLSFALVGYLALTCILDFLFFKRKNKDV